MCSLVMYDDDVVPYWRCINFICQCDADYFSRTSQTLEVRINQHLLTNIRKRNCDNLHKWVKTSGSVTAKHLINNPQCTRSYNQDKFSVFTTPLYAVASRPEFYQPLMIIYLIYRALWLWWFVLFAMHIFSVLDRLLTRKE